MRSIDSEKFGYENKKSAYQAHKPGVAYYICITLAIAGLLSFQNCSVVDRSVAQVQSKK